MIDQDYYTYVLLLTIWCHSCSVCLLSPFGKPLTLSTANFDLWGRDISRYPRMGNFSYVKQYSYMHITVLRILFYASYPFADAKYNFSSNSI